MRGVMKQQNGQTLVEVIVAVAILAFAMAAAGALATTTTRSSTEAGRRTQAAALASRETESIRSLRDMLAERGSGQDDTLHEYLTDNPDVLERGDCFYFVMRRDESSDTGWATVRPGSRNQTIRYTNNDFSDPGAFEGYENFSRVNTLCQAREYKATEHRYRKSEHIFDMEIYITWNEADNVPRDLTFRNAIITPEHADNG